MEQEPVNTAMLEMINPVVMENLFFFFVNIYLTVMYALFFQIGRLPHLTLRKIFYSRHDLLVEYYID